MVMRRHTGTGGWFAAVYTGMAAGGADDAVQVERVEATREGQPVPPEQALAVRLRQPDGTYLVLTSDHEGPHQVDGQTLSGPLAAVRLE